MNDETIPTVIDVPEVGHRSSAADVLRAGLAAGAQKLVDHAPFVGHDRSDDEVVHQARVGARRMRSDLRTLRPLVERAWADPVRDELRWLAGELGAVRDLDVLRARLQDHVATLSEADAGLAAPVLGDLERERDAALDAAAVAAAGERWSSTLLLAAEAARHPHVRSAAERPAAEVLPRLARKAFRTLAAAVDDLGPNPPDDDLHAVRILAKRARYAADVAVPVVGKPASRFASALADLQDVLGDLHDRAVGQEWLRSRLGDADGRTGYAIGLLVAAEREEAEELRHRWRPVWEHLERPKRTAWLEG